MIRKVIIPSQDEHEGFSWNRVTVTLRWYCPVCGHLRGEPHKTISYDGSRRLYDVDGWINPCGHVDKWADVREEAYSFMPDDDDADAASGDADRITPDPAGEQVDDAVTDAPASTSTSPYTPRLLWRFKMAMMMRYGRYSAQTKRAFALFDSIYPQYA